MRIISYSDHVPKIDRIKDLFSEVGMSLPIDLILEGTGVESQGSLRTHFWFLRKQKIMDIRIINDEGMRVK